MLSRHAIDSVAERWLSLADGSLEVVQAMLDASSIEIGVVGCDARHLRRRLGVPPNVVPIESASRALADTLRDLGHVAPGAKVLVCVGQWMAAAADDEQLPAMAASLLQRLRDSGAEAECVFTHAIRPNGGEGDESSFAAELELLRSGAVDALCAGSVEELRALAAGTPGDAEWPAVLVALGEETAACARELAPQAEVLELGSHPDESAVVEALEAHFGAGRLLF